LPGEDAAGELVFDAALDGAPHGAGAERRVVALVDELVAGSFGEFEVDAAVGETLAHFVDQQTDDLLEFVAGERLEDDDLVEPVEELRPEMFAQGAVDGLAQGLVVAFAVLA